MATLVRFRDGRAACWARVDLDNGDPIWISIARTGVVVKRSRLGFMGATLYRESNVYNAARTSLGLDVEFVERTTPAGMMNPVLRAFSQAALVSTSAAQLSVRLNQAAPPSDPGDALRILAQDEMAQSQKQGQRLSPEKPLVLRGGAVSVMIAHLITKALLALLAVFIFAAVQWVRHGTRSDYPILLVGSLLSAAAIPGYAFLALAPKGRRSVPLALAAISGFVPYLFGVYLVLYRGFWSLTALAQGFSALVLLGSAIFVILGTLIVYGTYNATEFVRRASEGTIVIE